MRKRVITAVIGLPLLFAILYLGDWWLFAGCLFLSCSGLMEYANALNHRLENRISLSFVLILGILLTMSMKLDLYTALAFFMVALVAVFCYEIFSGKADVYRAIATTFGLIYIPMMFGFLMMFENIKFGNYYLWMVFVIAFVTDTAAFFVGGALKGAKLAPLISPKKTRSGAIGGVIFACGAMIGYGLMLQFVFHLVMPFYLYGILGIVGSIAGQCGDLTASMIKRKMDIKDFGKILPGHGGILDRFDSILFIIPLVFLFAMYTAGLA